MPTAPERTHLQFILARGLLAPHAPGDVRPRHFAPRRKAALAAFEGVNVVRRAETGGPQERNEILEASLPQFRRLAARQAGPGIDLHVIRRQGIESADRMPGGD